jgi:hypothetical protein
MKSNFAQALIGFSFAIAMSIGWSSTALTAAAEWPFPTDPSKPAETYPIQDLGTCKIITEGLVVVPGNSKDPKGTVHFGSTATLTYQVVARDAVLTVVFEGRNGLGKPVSNKFETKLGVSIGTDYNSFSYDAADAADELRELIVDLEVTERTKNDIATKAILSTLARSNAVNPRTGASFVRTNTARFLCDLKP